MDHPSSISKTILRTLPVYLHLAVLLGVYFLIRWVMACSPFFSETYYDEAVTGNMALHILRGQHQLFFWGQPYMGSLEAYLASSLFFVFGPSALTLHLTSILVCAFLLFLTYQFGFLTGGRSVGLLAALLWAIAPLYLSVIGLLATGGHEEACALGAFVLFGICRLGFRPAEDPLPLAGLIGLAAGIGFWSSLLSAPYLLVGAGGLAAVRPRLLTTRLPWVGMSGFLMGSLPFWLWEIRHDFSTFTFFQGQGVGLFDQIWTRIYYVLRYSLFQSLLGDWWDAHSVLPTVPPSLAWAIWLVFYLPPFILSLLVIAQWVRRIIAFRPPLQGPLDLLVAIFWALVLAFATSEQGASGSLRYSLTFYLPFLVLAAVWLSKILAFRRWLGGGLLAGLLVFNLLLYSLFLHEFRDWPYRPIDGLIQSLQAHHIRFAYADIRIALPLTFESREKIICADFYGQRNYDYLRAVEQAPAGQVAIIAHRGLGNPPPETLGASLEMIGGRCERLELGNYVVWHRFQEPAPHLRPISGSEWRITASRNLENVALMKDRDVLSAWEVPATPGEWFQVDLGKVRSLGRVSLLPGMETGRLRIEVSRDGKSWEVVKPDRDFLSGLIWFKGRPSLGDKPRLIQINFPSRKTRYLRLTNLFQPGDPQATWGIAELFIYESVEKPAPPNPPAEKALALAGQALEHWRDDPIGPHPLFPGTDMTFRRKRVPWTEVIRQAQTAIRFAPHGEEGYRLLTQALALGELSEPSGQPLKTNDLKFSCPDSLRDVLRIPPVRFTASANFNNREAGAAIDGDPFTRWGTLQGQVPGMFFQVDLGERRPVSGFSLFLNRSIYDYPRDLKILASSDRENWQEVRANSLVEYTLTPRGLIKYNTHWFHPLPVRYLKLIQTGSDARSWWSIYEMEIWAATEAKTDPDRFNLPRRQAGAPPGRL